MKFSSVIFLAYSVLAQSDNQDTTDMNSHIVNAATPISDATPTGTTGSHSNRKTSSDHTSKSGQVDSNTDTSINSGMNTGRDTSRDSNSESGMSSITGSSHHSRSASESDTTSPTASSDSGHRMSSSSRPRSNRSSGSGNSASVNNLSSHAIEVSCSLLLSALATALAMNI